MFVLLSFLLISSLTYSTTASSISTVVRTNEEYDFQQPSLITKTTSKQRHPAHRFLQQCTINEDGTITCCEAGQCAYCLPSIDEYFLCVSGDLYLSCMYYKEYPDYIACCDSSSNCFECVGDKCCYLNLDNSGLETCCTSDFSGNVKCCVNDVLCFIEFCNEDGDSCSCKATWSDKECNSCEFCEDMSYGVSCDNVVQGFNVGCD